MVLRNALTAVRLLTLVGFGAYVPEQAVSELNHSKTKKEEKCIFTEFTNLGLLALKKQEAPKLQLFGAARSQKGIAKSQAGHGHQSARLIVNSYRACFLA